MLLGVGMLEQGEQRNKNSRCARICRSPQVQAQLTPTAFQVSGL